MDFFPLDPVANPWILTWLNSTIYTYATLILSGSQIIIMPCLFAIYIYDVYKTNGKIKKKTAQQRSLYYGIHIITLICIIFAFFAGILTFINNINIINNDKSCLPITISLNICWIIAKTSVYNVTLLRLQSIFWGTEYGAGKHFMISMYLIINCIFIMSIISSFLDIHSVHYNDPGEPGWCLYIIPTYLIFLPASLDLCFTPITMILLLKPLNQILHTDFSLPKDQDLSQLLTKYVLLSSIGIFSNVFSSIWFGVTDIVLFNDLDIVINPCCLFLMQTTHWNIYYCLCKCCHNALDKCLHKKVNEEEQSTNTCTVDLRDGKDNKSTTWHYDKVNLSAITIFNDNQSLSQRALAVTLTQTAIDANMELNGPVEDDNDVQYNDDDGDLERTTTSDLERGEFKRKWNIPPGNI